MPMSAPHKPVVVTAEIFARGFATFMYLLFAVSALLGSYALSTNGRIGVAALVVAFGYLVLRFWRARVWIDTEARRLIYRGVFRSASIELDDLMLLKPEVVEARGRHYFLAAYTRGNSSDGKARVLNMRAITDLSREVIESHIKRLVAEIRTIRPYYENSRELAMEVHPQLARDHWVY